MLLGTCHQIGFGVSALESLLLGEGVESVIGYIGDDPEIDGTTPEDMQRKASCCCLKQLVFAALLTTINVEFHLAA